MAFPIVQSSVAVNYDGLGATASHTGLALPSTVSAGDLLLFVFWTSAAGAQTVSFPAGWTELLDAEDASATIGTAIAYKTASGSEGGTTITVTTSAITLSIYASYAISNWDGVPEVSAASGTTTADPPSITPTFDSVGTLWMVGTGAYKSGSGTITAAPSGYSGLSTYNGVNNDMAVAYKQTVASSEDPGTFTISVTPTYTHSFTLAVKGTANTTSNLFFGSNF